MRERVPEVRHAEFVFELGGVVFLKFSRKPFQQGGPFGIGRLLFLLPRRHFLEADLLLHLVQEIKPGTQRESLQLIEPDLSLLLPFVMAGITVSVEEVLHSGSYFESLGVTFLVGVTSRHHQDREKKKRPDSKSGSLNE